MFQTAIKSHTLSRGPHVFAMQIETENLEPTVDSIIDHAITVISKFKVYPSRLKILAGLLLRHKNTGELRYYYASQNSYVIGGDAII